MRAEIVSVGSELLQGFTIDTHSAAMGRILAECGIDCVRRQAVSDDWEDLAAAIRDALERVSVVITIGGLGPTTDDLTRDAIAHVLGDELVHEPEVEAKLRAYFEMRKAPWTASQVRQAMRPESATLIDNPNGTAPGLACHKGGKTVIALPGPKGEFTPMAEGPVRTLLSKLAGSDAICSRTLKVVGLGESLVESKIRHLMELANPVVAPYAHLLEVHLRVTARGEDAAQVVAGTEAEIRSILGDTLFGADDDTLESVVLGRLIERGETLATAESITGGGLGQRLTSVPGCSGAFLGGVVTYAIEAKRELLGVSQETLDSCGPVSPEVAREMAAGIRERLGATYALSLTGNAGPTSDKDDKTVGLVYMGLAGPDGVEVKEERFRGTREDIRTRSCQSALVMLRNKLLNTPSPR